MEDILDAIKKNKGIKDNLTFERALVLYRKLRNLVKDDKSLIKIKNELKNYITQYESDFENELDDIDENELKIFDQNSEIAELERKFISERKDLILIKLNKINASQEDLGKLLGHKHKSYISQQINGVKPFTIDDLILISRVLKIELKKLIPPFISEQKRIRFYNAKSKSKNRRIKNLKLYRKDLVK